MAETDRLVYDISDVLQFSLAAVTEPEDCAVAATGTGDTSLDTRLYRALRDISSVHV